VTDQPIDDGEGALSINVDPEARHGSYANFLVVSHTAHEFTLDFCQSLPGNENALDVVSRIKVAPTMVGRILEALSENLEVYENSFGSVPHVG
jgi:hypothetical protein